VINRLTDPPFLPDDRPYVIEYRPLDDGVAFESNGFNKFSAPSIANVAADVEIKNLLNDTSYPELYQTRRKEWLDQILGNKQGPVEAAPSPIPDPKCVENPPDEAKSVPKDEALNAINKFCGEKKYWASR
jgi:hypothetical protein